MKKSVLIAFVLSAFFACKTENKQEKVIVQEEGKTDIVPISDAILEDAVIYEANIRQYSSKGSFDAFTKDIPKLKQLGVKVIWLMPINPISETKRKATGGDFASLIKDEAERNKMLGSYYAVSDYTKVNPEFGNIEDFRALVKTAHNNGMYVILDWVPNHTGWDHVWIKEHPEFYVKNAKGEITDPLNSDGTSKGWGDVAQLDYTNMAMQDEMIKDMMYWVENEHIDGFRCDHVEPTPVAFWEKAIPQLRAKRALFMLAENDDAKFMKGNDLFDMEYGWKLHHLMNDLAQGKKSVNDFDDLMTYIQTAYEPNDILMNFVTNHDENSWAGTVYERLDGKAELMTALSFMAPGMPLIYSGQEYDLNHRLKFFEKDSIPKTKGKMWPVLEKLGQLKNDNLALNGGKNPAAYKRLPSDKNILMFERTKNGKTAIFIANLSDKSSKIAIPLKGNYKDYMADKVIESNGDALEIGAWQYKILTN